MDSDKKPAWTLYGRITGYDLNARVTSAGGIVDVDPKHEIVIADSREAIHLDLGDFEKTYGLIGAEVRITIEVTDPGSMCSHVRA